MTVSSLTACRVTSWRSLASPAFHHTLSTVAIDVETGLDLGTGEGQAGCLRIFNNDHPQILALSPPCNVLSQIQRTNQNRRKDYEGWQQKYCEGLKLFGLLLFERQVLQGRLAVIEHPAQASSWRLPETRRLLANNMAVQCPLLRLVPVRSSNANGRAAHPEQNLPDVKLALHRQRVQPKMHGACAKHSRLFVTLLCSPSVPLAVLRNLRQDCSGADAQWVACASR